MKLRINIVQIVCLLYLIPVAKAQTLSYKNDTLPDWENPQITGINKERPHATLFVADEKYSDPEVVSLNGVWKFKWSPDPQSRPEDFYASGYFTEDWNDIVVPGDWQTEGFGIPIYTNITYPFERDPPLVMSKPPEYFTVYKDRNPVGSYCTFFNMKQDWNDKQVFLHFGGVSSAMYVWINGKKVG